MSPVGNAQSQRLAIPQVPEPTLHDIEFARTSQRVYQLFHNPSADPDLSEGPQSRKGHRRDQEDADRTPKLIAAKPRPSESASGHFRVRRETGKE